MKKKNLFHGVSSKLLLAAVVLSSSFMTGCYKDSGLDVINPDQNITLPAAKYTVTGTIYGADGVLTNAEITATQGTVNNSNNGSYTISDLKAGDVTITVKHSGYDTQSQTVTIAALNPGQAAVYPVNFVMGATAPEMAQLTYNLDVAALDADDMSDITANATIEVYAAGSTKLDKPYENLAAGTYKVKVSAEGYKTTIQYVNLAVVMVEKGTEAETTNVEVVLSKKEQENITISGDLKFSGRWMLAKVVRLFGEDGTQYYGSDNSNTYAYNFSVPATAFTKVSTTRAAGDVFNFLATLTIVDENGIEISIPQTFSYTEDETPSVPGEEKPNVEIKVDFSFNAVADVIPTDTVAQPLVDEFNMSIINAEESEAKYSYDMPMFAGTKKISDADYGSLNGESALAVAVKKAIEEKVATIEVVEDYTKIIKDNAFTLTLPARTALVSITSYQDFESFEVGVKELTSTTYVNGVATETQGIEITGFTDVFAKFVKAGAATVSQDGVKYVGIDHGHSHGHGTGNAGGGIGDPD